MGDESNTIGSELGWLPITHPNTDTMTIQNMGSLVMKIDGDLNLTFGDGVTPADEAAREAARIFAESVTESLVADRTEVAALRERVRVLEEVVRRVENVADYVEATVCTANEPRHITRDEWGEVHRGRASSSERQLCRLRDDARTALARAEGEQG